MLRKKFLSVALLCTIIVPSLPLNVFAMENNIHESDIILADSELNNIDQLENVGIDTKLVKKLLTVSNYIQFNNDQKTLRVALSDEVLMSEYNFTERELKDFKDILKGTYQSPNMIMNNNEFMFNGESNITTRSVARFYLSNEQLKAGTFAVLASAADVGPAALMAAWTAISSALAGPLGTVAGFSTAVLGSYFFADLALKITGAMVEGKGVAFYLDWRVPPVYTAIE